MRLSFAAPRARLWDKIGFKVLGVIPGAVQKNDGTYQDSMSMFRSLLD
jgi:hypothetical protein